MKVIKAHFSDKRITIGRQGENLSVRVIFDLKSWVDAYPAGQIYLIHKRSHDREPYPIQFQMEGGMAYWNVTCADTAFAGIGVCEAVMVCENVVAKSRVWQTEVLPALTDTADAPEPYQPWVDSVLQAAGEVAENAQKADEAVAHYPKLDEDGFLLFWDADSEEFVRCDTILRGQKGDTGDAGTDGETPYISENGNWWIGTTDTGVKASGEGGGSILTIHFYAGSVGQGYTVTDGVDETYTGVVSDTLTATVSLKKVNTTYTITMEDGGRETVTTGAYFGALTATLIYTKVFGVMWNSTNSSTRLTRLTSSNDPNGFVNTDITSDPVAAVGTGAGSSPFDNYSPWKDMEEYNVINGAVSYKKGEEGFSRSQHDTVVKIPAFYYKVMKSGSNWYFYISGKAIDGFAKHPGSDRYVGKYNTTAGYYSKSGMAPLTSVTRGTVRTNAKAKGAGWYGYDYATWCAIWLLYLVEFSDWDSQSKIGDGYVKVGTISNATSGRTDNMIYHTGEEAGEDYYRCIQYRGIENLWGNLWQHVDGININNYVAYVCTNPELYADNTSSNYTSSGVTLNTGSGWSVFIKDIGYSSTVDWGFFPKTGGGSSTTYIPDNIVSGSGWRALHLGAPHGDGTSGKAGLFFMTFYGDSEDAGEKHGSRLIFIPNN